MKTCINYKDFMKMEKPETHIIYFKGFSNPSSKESWCNEVIKAEPFIKNLVIPKAKEHDIPFYVVECGTLEQWSQAKHPLKTDPKFRLSHLPTMMYVEDGHQMNSIVESVLLNLEMIEMFFDLE